MHCFVYIVYISISGFQYNASHPNQGWPYQFLNEMSLLQIHGDSLRWVIMKIQLIALIYYCDLKGKVNQMLTSVKLQSKLVI